MANKPIPELETVTPSATSTVVGEKDGAVARFPIGGIIDVDTLPTENINANAIYRVPGGYSKAESALLAVIGGGIAIPAIIVDVLPEVGNPIMGENDNITPYYQCKDETLYAYVDEATASAGGVEAGWYLFSDISPMMFPNNTYYGTVYSEDEATVSGGVYCIVTGYESGNPDALYHYGSNGFTKIITTRDFEFNATTGTLVLNL